MALNVKVQETLKIKSHCPYHTEEEFKDHDEKTEKVRTRSDAEETHMNQSTEKATLVNTNQPRKIATRSRTNRAKEPKNEGGRRDEEREGSPESRREVTR